jgi:seryl-tRNA synthetase
VSVSDTRPTVTDDPYARFRDELLGAGLLVDTGVLGLYLRSGTFEQIAQGIDHLVTSAGADHDAPVLHFPLVMAGWVFERSDYLRSFPDLVGSVEVFTGDDAAHARLLAAVDAGEDWSDFLSPSDVMLCSAACHPLYPSCTGRLPDAGKRFEVFGNCFRHEPSIDPARMQTFRQHEFVYVGTPEGAREHRDLWIERGLSVLASIGLEAEAVVANDPFFGRAGRMLAANQRAEVLKYELVHPVATADRPTAIVSANCHLDHFATPFGIETSTGEVAHSACVGFGTERITLALLATHGLDPVDWPRAVRDALWP